MKYDSSGLGQAALPALQEFKPTLRIAQRPGKSTHALWADCEAALHGGFGEWIAWGVLSAATLMALVVSFLG